MQDNNAQHILIIRFSSMGDIVLTTPVIRALRTRFPQARLDFVTKRAFVELLQTNPHLDHVYAYAPQNSYQGLFYLARQLRKNRYDLCIDIHKNLRSHLLRFLIHPKHTVTYSKQVISRTLLVKIGINRYKEILQVPERYLKRLSAFRVVNDEKGLELFPTSQHYANVQTIFQQEHLTEKEPVIGFGPIASYPLKQWSPEKFITLGQQLIQQYHARIMIFGGPEDRQAGKTIAKQLPNSPIVLCGRVSLLESAAALERCAIFVGNDTGTVHIATAMKTPVIVLFGPTTKEFGFYPYRIPSQIICKPLPCRPCTHTGKGTCKIKDTHACMKQIRVKEVREAVENFLNDFLLTSSEERKR